MEVIESEDFAARKPEAAADLDQPPETPKGRASVRRGLALFHKERQRLRATARKLAIQHVLI